jgi:protein arginine kinase
MKINSIIENPSELIQCSNTTPSIILSSRIRLARNLKQWPFPGWAKKKEMEDVLSQCMEVIGSLPKMKRGLKFSMQELNVLEKQILMERHLISQELMNTTQKAGVFISKNQDCAIMINEEDHLRIQFMRTGLKFKAIWKSINTIDDRIEEHLDYAFSPELGYLTSCPTNVGTGMRVSAMMHLPALVFSGQMERVIRAVNQVGIVVRGLFGEGSEASGSIFQISNQQTLGIPEEDIIKNLTKFLTVITEQENNARQKLLEEQTEKLYDKIGRACGILTHSCLLSSAEAMNLLSFLRLGVDLKIIFQLQNDQLNRLFIESQPGHIQYATQHEISPKERDRYRAEYFRKELSDLPTLDFSKHNTHE